VRKRNPSEAEEFQLPQDVLTSSLPRFNSQMMRLVIDFLLRFLSFCPISDTPSAIIDILRVFVHCYAFHLAAHGWKKNGKRAEKAIQHP
jgi:hypothetical protein